MGHGPGAFVAMFLGGWAELSRLLVLGGLVLAIVNTARFLARRPSVELAAAEVPARVTQAGIARQLRGAYPSVWWPLVLLWAGFLVGGHLRSGLWIIAAGVLVAAVVGLGIRWLRLAHARRLSETVAPAALAVLLTAGVLILFGLLMTIRLVVAPYPDTRLGAGLTRDASYAAVRAVFVPALVLWVVVAGLGVPWLRRIRFARPPRRGDRTHLLAIAGVFVLFAAPSLGDGLTILGIATPEYGKILYFVALASMLGEYAYQVRLETGAPKRSDLLRARRYLWFPIGLFAAVGVASLIKRDIGPMIPMFVGTVAVFGTVLWAQAGQSLEVAGAHGRRRRAALRRVARKSTRPFRVPVAVLVLIGVTVMVFTPYISERGAIWADPWAYAWAAPCVPPPAAAKPVPTPPETEACQVSRGSVQASGRSQVSQSLAVIADGGAWGRGLDDTTSGRVPAGSTDFVLAVVWSKLGGIVVLLLGVVLALLAAALIRVGPQVSGAGPPPAGRSTVDPARLYVVGLAAMIVGQFLFVLAATVNALPHSGITAPFLSRGGHSTIALGVGVIAAMVVQYRRGGTEPRTANPGQRPARTPAPAPATVSGWWARRRVPATAVVLLICLTLVTGITLAPYNGLAEDRKFCLAPQAKVDSTACSTDRVAYDRTEVRLVLDGAPRYVRTGSGSTWIPIGTPEVSLTELSGLLDLGLTHDVDGFSGTSLGSRLGPPSDTAAAGTVELTVRPGVQRDTARALTKEVDGIPPLPSGAVVIEARTGHVLAAATTTGDSKADAPTGPVDPNVLRSWTRSHPFAVRDNNGDIDESKRCSESDVDNCWRVSLVPAKPPVNRALSLWYGLGSTFKVVVATAFLRQPGNSAGTLIPAPLTIAAGDHEIKNASGGACPKSVQGMISLADALAVSCNTAFVKLAMDLEWPAIRQAAVDYGFVVGPTANVRPDPAWVAGTRLGIDSRVPKDAGGDIGNDALGGGGVVGTPLELATVMAAVANGGTVHKPIVVAAVTPARGGNRVVTQGESRAVLTPEQAAQLKLALAGTTEPFGTAKSLHAPDGRPLWVKTGTHVKNTGAVAPAGSTPPEIAWMIGFLETPPGPVAFAVAVETTDEAQGAARARWLTEQIIASIVKARP